MNKIMQIYGGRFVNPKNLSLDDIDIEAIAHSLSQQCRFAGHTQWHYSVAQHSVYVSRLCSPDTALCGLLHDATEAYLVDIPSLIKALHEFDSYNLIESYIWAVIAYKYNLPIQIPEEVKSIDKAMLWLESNALMLDKDGVLDIYWYQFQSNIPSIAIEELSCAQAKRLFLDRFYDLTGETNVS